jgi:hypothetical protein
MRNLLYKKQCRIDGSLYLSRAPRPRTPSSLTASRHNYSFYNTA